MAIFLGDFGNENVDAVRTISKCPVPKAVILGNHDAWFSQTARRAARTQRALMAGVKLDNSKGCRVQQQLDLLGSDHVGYSAKQVSSCPVA